MVRVCLAFMFIINMHGRQQLFLPIQVQDRTVLEERRLTVIGQYGLKRKARPTVPSHYHTGVDLKRPTKNYSNEPVFSGGVGKVLSVRSDGPFSQIIIQHVLSPGDTLWTVYEHILGIVCHSGQQVTENTVIARFFNKEELNKFGWQFDHVHFEMLKFKPVRLNANPKYPEYHFKTYAIVCYTQTDLHKYTINPMDYFRRK